MHCSVETASHVAKEPGHKQQNLRLMEPFNMPLKGSCKLIGLMRTTTSLTLESSFFGAMRDSNHDVDRRWGKRAIYVIGPLLTNDLR